MNHKELTYLLAVAEQQSLSRAAEKLYLSQSTLSRYLQRAEQDLGVPLFKRTSVGLVPTEAGNRFIKSAKQILKISRDLENDISRMNHLQTGHLVIGTTNQLSTVLLPDILRTFGGVYPGIEIKLVEDDPAVIESKLLDGMVDLAFLHLPLTNPTIQYQEIARENILIAVPPDDPVNEMAYKKEDGKRPYLDIRLIAARDFILTHPSQGTRQVAQRILNHVGIQPRIKYLTRNMHTAIRMVNLGLGVTLVPHSYGMTFGDADITKLYRIEDRFSPQWTVAVCYLPGDQFSIACQEFIQVCVATLPYLFKQ